MTAATIDEPERTFMERMLDGIERLGNKVPHPAVLFLWLCLIVIVLSQGLFWLNVKATYETVTPPPVAAQERYDGGSTQPSDVTSGEPAPAKDYKAHTETAKVKGLLTGDGVRFMFTSLVKNFQEFSALTIILVVMIGVGLAETAGLIGALVRKLVAVSSASTLTFIIVLIGVVSSIASDAGYLVLIPLGAVAFMSVGRHPLAGIAAGFAGVSAGFGVNFLITPTDGVLTEITNQAIHLVDPKRSIDITSNLYFGIGSTILVTVVCALITTRLVEPRLGRYDPADAGEAAAEDAEALVVSPADEARGLRYAGWGALAVIIAVALLTAIPGAPLRNPKTGDVIGDSPFMDSIVVIITLVFLAAGLCYGRGARTIKTSNDAINAVTKSWAGLASLLFLFFLIAQFIAYFNFSNVAQVVAVKLGDLLEKVNIGAVWLMIGVILITTVVNLIIPAAIAKWALLAPIFIPLFIRLGVAPQTVLAAYRVGDSPTNVITPPDGVLPAARRVRPALRQESRHRQRHIPDAALRDHPRGRLDHLLRDLVSDRDPARPRSAGAPRLSQMRRGRPRQLSGLEISRSMPRRADRNLATSWPFTLFPARSRGGANVPIPPFPGETVTIPPPIPLFAGRPTSYSQSPEPSYNPAVSITASVWWQTRRSMTRSLVTGFTPPSAKVAPITARSLALTCSEHCLV
jgi:aminobenzoyl-glutamate transport protein